MEKERIFFFQVDVDGFLHVDCMRIPEQEGTPSFQANVGVNPKTITVQVAARQEFSKLSRDRQQRGTASNEPNKQFDPGG